jgi:hypothetical protein
MAEWNIEHNAKSKWEGIDMGQETDRKPTGTKPPEGAWNLLSGWIWE